MRGEVVRDEDDIVSVLHEIWDLAARGRLEQAGERARRVVEHVGRAEVDFREHHEYGHRECEREPEVLARGAHEAHVRADHKHRIVRRVARHAEHCRLQVALVSREVDERADLEKEQ